MVRSILHWLHDAQEKALLWTSRAWRAKVHESYNGMTDLLGENTCEQLMAPLCSALPNESAPGGGQGERGGQGWRDGSSAEPRRCYKHLRRKDTPTWRMEHKCCTLPSKTYASLYQVYKTSDFWHFSVPDLSSAPRYHRNCNISLVPPRRPESSWPTLRTRLKLPGCLPSPRVSLNSRAAAESPLLIASSQTLPGI